MQRALSPDIADILASSSELSLRFPWESLEGDLARIGQNSLALAGYGSLLNEESARRTVKNTPLGGHEPVVAFGARRIFNYIMPMELIQNKYGVAEPGNRIAALNTLATASPTDMFNARLLRVGADDFDDLRIRERGYDLAPVAFVPWCDLGRPPQLAFTLCAPEDPVEGPCFVSNEIAPFEPYLKLCREGARAVDPEFAELFMQTTWLADNRSRLDQRTTENPPPTGSPE